MELMAICTRCHGISGSGIFLENSTDMRIRGAVASCRICGGMSRIPDGVYSTEPSVDNQTIIIAKVLEALNKPSITVSELRGIEKILRQAKSEGATAEQAVRAVSKTIPSASGLLTLLSLFQSDEHGSRTDKLALLVAIMALFVSIMTAYGQMPERLTDDTIRRIVVQAQKEMRQQPASPLPPTSPFPPRQ